MFGYQPPSSGSSGGGAAAEAVNVVAASGTSLGLDVGGYDVHDITVTGNCLIGFTNAPDVRTVVLLFSGDGTERTVTLPGGATVSVAADADHFAVTAQTLDEGTSWRYWAAGEPSTVAGGGLGGAVEFARKTVDESINTSTTLQDDDELFINVAANTVYVVDAQLIVSAANNTPDVLLGWSGPAGATFDWTPGALLATTTTVTGSISLIHRAIGETSSIGATTATAIARPSGLLVVGGTSGVFRARWAQNTSDAGNSTVKAGSYLRAMAVA
jgi:hypothetical protein